MKKYDYLIVGAGLYGAVFAHQAKIHGYNCLVIDRRPHLGGNVYCENLEGINIHKYGAHIFHTSNKKVWDYVTSLVDFNRYTNCPIANFNGQLYNLPFNMNTFYQMWGVMTPNDAYKKLEEQRQEAIYQMQKNGIETPRNLEEQALSLVGKDIYEKLIKGYTEKQWGRKCDKLPAFIIKRLPLRHTFDNNYFNDTFQGIPIGGYNKLIDKLLEGIETAKNTDFFSKREHWESISNKIVFTGAIDEYYDYKFGKLEYRTVRFETEVLNCPNFQGNAVVNYTDSTTPYTRVIEHKHFEAFGDDIFNNPKTIISREYSTEWKDGMEPYYPVNDAKNNALFDNYKALAQTETNVIFGGRLAQYRYYDMDKVIEQALNYWE